MAKPRATKLQVQYLKIADLKPYSKNAKPGDGVYEPFAGSGTTLIAAHMEGRVCYGVEIDPTYGRVIIDRWEAFTGEKALLDGKTPLSAIVTPKKRRKP